MSCWNICLHILSRDILESACCSLLRCHPPRVLYSLTIPPCGQDWAYSYLKYICLNVFIYNALISTSTEESCTSFIDSAEPASLVSGAPDMLHFTPPLVRSILNPELSMGTPLALHERWRLRSRLLCYRQVKSVEINFAWSSWLVLYCRDWAVTCPGNLP